MNQTNTEMDPIVQILILAARRGRVVQRELAEKDRTLLLETMDGETLIREQEDSEIRSDKVPSK